jgi:hypothetical protein
MSDYQKAKEGKPMAAMVDQRQLNAKASIADIVAAMENDRQESVRNLTQAQEVLIKWFLPLCTRI